MSKVRIEIREVNEDQNRLVGCYAPDQVAAVLALFDDRRVYYDGVGETQVSEIQWVVTEEGAFIEIVVG